jgi:hypothetical protein
MALIGHRRPAVRAGACRNLRLPDSELRRDIDTGVLEETQHADGWMVIKHENAVLIACDHLGAPIALRIPEHPQKLARRHAVIFPIDPYSDELLTAHGARRGSVPSQPAAAASPLRHDEKE